MELQMPNGFFWQSPPPQLPLRAIGVIVVDTSGMTIATCPNSSCADAIAFHINAANGVHPFSGASLCFPYGVPEPGQRNADDMGMPGTIVSLR